MLGLGRMERLESLLCRIGLHRYSTKGVPGIYLRVCKRCHHIH